MYCWCVLYCMVSSLLPLPLEGRMNSEVGRGRRCPLAFLSGSSAFLHSNNTPHLWCVTLKSSNMHDLWGGGGGGGGVNRPMDQPLQNCWRMSGSKRENYWSADNLQLST